MAMAQLFRELLRWLRLTIRLFTVWQTPLALFAKRQRQELSQCQLMLVAIRSDANGHGILRHVAAQGAMEFIPPAKNRAPV
jgi:hypothetical protein